MSDFKSLIEALCALPSETEYVEFKESYSDFNKEGRDICALSNSAALKNVPRAYKIWGITDNTHEIVGTTFDPRKTKKGKGVRTNSWTVWSSQESVCTAKTQRTKPSAC